MTTSDFRVTLLGTGTPVPRPTVSAPATLVEAGDVTFLVDAGRSATIRLCQIDNPIGRIDVQLLRHYHSHHASGVPDVADRLSRIALRHTPSLHPNYRTFQGKAGTLEAPRH
jgi:ribonuclease BN (tRNA processing enzyme)